MFLPIFFTWNQPFPVSGRRSPSRPTPTKRHFQLLNLGRRPTAATKEINLRVELQPREPIRDLIPLATRDSNASPPSVAPWSRAIAGHISPNCPSLDSVGWDRRR
jgi:hypothetical protein